MSLQFKADKQQFEFDVAAVKTSNVNISSLTATYPVFADSNGNLVTFPPVPLPTSTYANFQTLVNNGGSYLGTGVAPFTYSSSKVSNITIDPTSSLFTIPTAGEYLCQLSVPVSVNSNGNPFVANIQDQAGVIYANCSTFSSAGGVYAGNFTLSCTALISAAAGSQIEFTFQNATGANAFVNGVQGSILRIA